ncbi:hypothetical protein, partial [Kitasatospora griseola]|uniref:hypothetical protein n=1 Tax=Kitasatospora griseola TaxID=2064 RepID=UPI00381D90B4
MGTGPAADGRELLSSPDGWTEPRSFDELSRPAEELSCAGRLGSWLDNGSCVDGRTGCGSSRTGAPEPRESGRVVCPSASFRTGCSCTGRLGSCPDNGSCVDGRTGCGSSRTGAPGPRESGRVVCPSASFRTGCSCTGRLGSCPDNGSCV